MLNFVVLACYYFYSGILDFGFCLDPRFMVFNFRLPFSLLSCLFVCSHRHLLSAFYVLVK